MASAADPPPAWAHTAWSARAMAHPKIAEAMAGGILSESWARALCDITGKLPADKVDEADGLLVWTKLHGADFSDLLALAWEIYAKSLPDGPDPGTLGPQPATCYHAGRRRRAAWRPDR
jgi:hypothetical protein